MKISHHFKSIFIISLLSIAVIATAVIHPNFSFAAQASPNLLSLASMQTSAACPEFISAGDFTPSPSNVLFDDLNGDGRADAYTLRSGGFTVWLNNGSGVFSGPTEYNTPTTALSLFDPGDLSGDGKRDFLFRYTVGSTTFMVVYRNKGDGTYEAAQTISLLQIGSTVAGGTASYSASYPGDYNGDGKSDFITAVRTTRFDGTSSIARILVYRNNGDGTFTGDPSVDFFDTSANYEFSTVQDFNLDGALDFALLLSRSGFITNVLIYNNLQGPPYLALSERQRIPVTQSSSNPRILWDYLSASSIPSDNYIDLQIQGNSFANWYGSASGTFSQTPPAGNPPRDTSPRINLNNDSVKDSYEIRGVTATDSDLVIKLGNNDGTFRTVATARIKGFPTVDIADFNGDGKNDFGLKLQAPGGTPSYSLVISGTGESYSSTPLDVNLGSGATGVQVFSLNGDNKADLIVTRGTTYSMLVNNSNCVAAPVNTPPTITAAAALTRQQGSSGTISTIATVTDTETAVSNLTVTATTIPTGLTVTNITNTNGTITAQVTARCDASVSANTVVLTVSDGTATATANLTVNVSPNTSPQPPLYSPANVTLGQSQTITPSVLPRDNGSITDISIAPNFSFRGGVSINSSGVINITNASPVGTHTFIITATDNCGLGGQTTFSLTVNADTNTPPRITLNGIVTRGLGEAGTAIVATVTDAETPAGNLTVRISDLPGIIISSVTNNNGSISANIGVAANALPNSFYIVSVIVTDSGGLFATAQLNIFVKPSSNTSTGANVAVTSNNTTVTFSNVTTAGNTTITPITPAAAGALPNGYTLVNGSLAFEVTTTAVFSGPITLTFNVPSVTDAAVFSTLRVLHGEGSPQTLVDRTVLAPDSPAPNFAAKQISARVNSLSPFVIAALANTPPPTGCTVTQLQQPTNYSTAATPSDVSYGDFNGDGKPDLITANYEANAVSVMLNNGNGGFAPAVIYPVGTNPKSVTVGDLNGDGKPDLVVANMVGGDLSILLGNGAGGFTQAPKVTGMSYPVSSAIGDLNGDGKADLVIANAGSYQTTIMFGKGDGTFTFGFEFFKPEGGLPAAVVTADFDKDGRLDFAVAYNNTNRAIVYFNRPGGYIDDARILDAGDQPLDMVTGDFNGDGYADLAVANYASNDVTYLTNTKTANFTKTSSAVGKYPRSLAVTDFNGDKFDDLVVANDGTNFVTTLVSNQSGAPTRKDILANESPSAVTATDFNGDGKPDVIVADYWVNRITTYQGACASAFAPEADATGLQTLRFVQSKFPGDPLSRNNRTRRGDSNRSR